MPETPIVTLPVARVAVDVSLAHLDRPFDYRVGPAEDEAAVPGARVRVRFAGRLRDGFVLERLATSDSDRELSPLSKVISSEPVLTPEIATLIRAVADHYAGCFADVLRLAVPPRHAATEKAEPAARPPLPDLDRTAVRRLSRPTRSGRELLDALRSGGIPRAYWQVIPAHHASGDWADGFAAAARATVDSGRSAVLVVPDQRDLATAASRLHAGARTDRLRRADRRGRSGGPLSRLPGRPARRRPGRDRQPGRGLRTGARPRSGGVVGRRRRPARRAACALPAHAHRAGPAGDASSGRAVLFAGYGRSCEAEQLLQRGWLSGAGRRPDADPAHRTPGAGDGRLRPGPGP